MLVDGSGSAPIRSGLCDWSKKITFSARGSDVTLTDAKLGFLQDDFFGTITLIECPAIPNADVSTSTMFTSSTAMRDASHVTTAVLMHLDPRDAVAFVEESTRNFTLEPYGDITRMYYTTAAAWKLYHRSSVETLASATNATPQDSTTEIEPGDTCGYDVYENGWFYGTSASWLWGSGGAAFEPWGYLGEVLGNYGMYPKLPSRGHWELSNRQDTYDTLLGYAYHGIYGPKINTVDYLWAPWCGTRGEYYPFDGLFFGDLTGYVPNVVLSGTYTGSVAVDNSGKVFASVFMNGAWVNFLSGGDAADLIGAPGHYEPIGVA